MAFENEKLLFCIKITYRQKVYKKKSKFYKKNVYRRNAYFMIEICIFCIMWVSHQFLSFNIPGKRLYSLLVMISKWYGSFSSSGYIDVFLSVMYDTDFKINLKDNILKVTSETEDETEFEKYNISFRRP